MKNSSIFALLLLFVSSFVFVYAQENSPTPEQQAFEDEDGQVFSDSDFGEEVQGNNELTNKMVFLDAVQKHFWNPKRKLQDNTINILHKDGDTHKIRTRYAMITTFIFDDDRIAEVILGDPNGFEVRQIPNQKWNLSNILTIKPKLIGIDTNLLVIGESGTIYTFYVFSTHFTNRRDPAFSVFVSKNRSIGKIAMENLQDESKSNSKFKRTKSTQNPYITHNEEVPDTRKIPSVIIEEDDGEFITIGDKVNTLHIDKSKMQRGYLQEPKSTRKWKSFFVKRHSRASVAMQAVDIFNDKDYTYFKFDREDATSKFPVIFKVVDGYDNPVNTKIVGNYIIAEDLSEKWTLKMGDEWVCVRKLDKPMVVKEAVKDHANSTAPTNSTKLTTNDSAKNNTPQSSPQNTASSKSKDETKAKSKSVFMPANKSTSNTNNDVETISAPPNGKPSNTQIK